MHQKTIAACIAIVFIHSVGEGGRGEAWYVGVILYNECLHESEGLHQKNYQPTLV